MAAPDFLRPRSVVAHGIGAGNVGLVQLLGLCPLLAVSNNAVNALGLGLATLLALLATNTAISLLRGWTVREVRIPAFVIVIAAVVTAIELAMHAWLPALHAVLGLFLPLIVTNCAIMGRAEAFASRQPVGRAALDALGAGLGFLWVLLVLGVAREVLGHGTVFTGAGRLLGAPWLEWTLLPGYRGFLLAVLAPGAFVLLALLIALRNRLGAGRAASPAAAEDAPPVQPVAA